jgi:hypothetical protein
MICRICRIHDAEYFVTEPVGSGRFVEAHLCLACYEARYAAPRSRAPFPRPRFTLKNIMMVVGMFTVVNAILALGLRLDSSTGPPEQHRWIVIQLFLMWNLGLGFCLIILSAAMWLRRVSWHYQTGGQVPMPVRRMTLREHLALLGVLVPVLVWGVLVLLLERWLAWKVWNSRGFNPALFAWIGLTPLLAIGLVCALKDRPSIDRARERWRLSSRRERAFRISVLLWGSALAVVLLCRPGLLIWGMVLWFPMPPVILIWCIGMLAIKAAAAFSARPARGEAPDSKRSRPDRCV